MKRQYFGTDGIRGIAGEFPMSAAFAFRVGVAAAETLKGAGADAPTVLIGMDTRHSGAMLLQALSAGLLSRGANVVTLGVLPTPGVSFLCRHFGADAGVVISASHNPFEDNGIKFFNKGGEKLSDKLEHHMESLLDEGLISGLPGVTGAEIGTLTHKDEAAEVYLSFLQSVSPSLEGLKIGLDCANGAAYALAPKLFKALGAQVDVINDAPDGLNINLLCGSTHPEALQKRVLEHGLDLGVTFDGDADRALMVDARGRLVSGDHMLAITARMRGEKRVVSTIMGNLGLEHYLAAHGIELLRANVGDRYVHEMLNENSLTLGGEQSGHILFLDKAPTGDGMLSALQTLAALRASGQTLEAWVDEVVMYPQTLLNVRVAPAMKAHLAEHEAVQRALEEAEGKLSGTGRINVRPSGTEPLVRVMVEGRDKALIEAIARDVAAVIEAAA